MSLAIRSIREDEIAAFGKLAVKHGGVFVSDEWLALFPQSIRMGIFRNGKELIGGWVYQQDRLKGIKAEFNLPLTPHCGLFFDDPTQNPSQKLSFHKEVSSSLANYIQKHGASFVDLGLPPQYMDMQPFTWNKLRVVPAYTYRIDLRQSLDKIHAAFSPKTRNAIKSAEDAGMTGQACDDPNVILKVIFNTMDSKGLKYDRTHVESVVRTSLSGEWSFAYVCYKDGEPVGGSFCIHDDEMAYYILGGSPEVKGKGQSSVSCLKSSIDHAKEMGLNTFDFEGSMIPEVEKYFRGFGGQLTPYFKIRKASIWVEGLLRILKPDRWF